MTELMQKQIKIMFFMAVCGLSVGLVIDIFKLFVRQSLAKNKYIKAIIGFVGTIVVAYLIGEYSFFCQSGKITFTGMVTFFGGLLLWYKYFYDIISLGEEYEQKRKKAPRVREE